MKQLLEKIRQMKKDQILIVLLSGILLLVIAMPSESGSETEKSAGVEAEEIMMKSEAGEKEKLEQQLQELLTQAEGVGEAKVMIALRSDGRKIVEKDLEQSQEQQEENGEGQVSSSKSGESSEITVYQKDGQGNEIPYVTEQEMPEITGVLVLAQGGGNPAVKQEITEAVMALFGVEAHKIKVMRMK